MADPASAAPPMIACRDVAKTYFMGKLAVPVLHGVTCTIAGGEFVALLGTSGSGKTTLMNILGCLDRPTSGSYRLDGVEVSGLSPDQRADLRSRRIGFVFQSFHLLPRTSALDNVLMPLAYARRSAAPRAARERATALLERVGLADRLDHHPSRLSGGQQQRVAIARALVNDPSLLLADEPTGNLDSKTSEEILDMLAALNHEVGLTILLVTHEPSIGGRVERTLHMTDGVIDRAPASPRAHAREGAAGGPR